MVFIGDFFAHNFLSIILLCCLLYLSLTDIGLSKTAKRCMYSVMISISIMLVCDYLDQTVTSSELYNSWTLSVPYWKIRNIASGFGYAFRPMTLAFAIGLLYTPKAVLMNILAIPAIANLVLSLCSIKTGWIYRINSQNGWEPGPLRLLYFIVAAFYFVLMIVFSIIRWSQSTSRERFAVFFVLSSILISSILDVVIGGYQTLMLATVCAFFMYYLCIYTNKSNNVIKNQVDKMEKQKIDLLKAQLEPVFICGALNTAEELCTKDMSKTKELLHTIAFYLRYSINLKSSTEFCPVEYQIEHCRAYSDIFMVKNPEINIVFDIDDGNYEIPSLIIQPMIEDAISRADGKKAKITVTLTSEQTSGNITHIIIVRDNIRESSVNAEMHQRKIAFIRSRIEKEIGGTLVFDKNEKTGSTMTVNFDLSSIPMKA